MSIKEAEEILREIESFKSDNRKVKAFIFKADRALRHALRTCRESAMTGEDVFTELIESLIEGKRKRSRDAIPNFEVFLYSQIRSIVWNIANREKRFPPVEDRAGGEEGNPEDASPDLRCNDNSIEEYEAEEFVEQIRKELESDVTAGVVFEELTNDKDGREGRDAGRARQSTQLPRAVRDNENEEIADDLGITVQEVVNAKRKIQRRVDRILNNNKTN